MVSLSAAWDEKEYRGSIGIGNEKVRKWLPGDCVKSRVVIQSLL
jgi:hypothetical protein